MILPETNMLEKLLKEMYGPDEVGLTKAKNWKEVSKKWLEQKPSDYTVTYIPEANKKSTEYLDKGKLLAELEK